MLLTTKRLKLLSSGNILTLLNSYRSDCKSATSELNLFRHSATSAIRLWRPTFISDHFFQTKMLHTVGCHQPYNTTYALLLHHQIAAQFLKIETML